MIKKVVRADGIELVDVELLADDSNPVADRARPSNKINDFKV